MILERIQQAYTHGSFDSDTSISKLEVKAGKLLLEPDELQAKAFIVEKGCLRSYLIDEAGKDHTIQFAPEGWIVGDMEAVSMSKRTTLFIEAIEPSIVYSAPNDVYQRLMFDDIESLKQSVRALTNRVVALQRRLVSQLAADATLRYEEFIDTYPQLANRVPLKHIASYLGITPESLSRVRKQLTEKVH